MLNILLNIIISSYLASLIQTFNSKVTVIDAPKLYATEHFRMRKEDFPLSHRLKNI